MPSDFQEQGNASAPAGDPLDAARQTAPEAADVECDRIVGEELKVLARVQRLLVARRQQGPQRTMDYDAELLSLRDQIMEARLEDIPPLIEEMERLQQVAARRAMVTESLVDPGSPYFGRMILEEGDRKREVLIGRGTFLDSRTGIRIVDWRDAPVSRLYYRYDEGDDYEENFGGRDVEGEILTRRSLAIVGAQLRRIGAPQGTFLPGKDGTWRRAADGAMRLSGGQGAAMRAEGHHQIGKLGVGADGGGREDKHLAEVTALIDPRQFDLITRPGSGLVVIQGGAGSGKTTIGLHRLAYLAYQDKRRFRADSMLVIAFNDALARYISRVLPALGVPNVGVLTFERWAHKQRVSHIDGLPLDYEEDTPTTVVRLKKHPMMLRLIDEYVERIGDRVEKMVDDALAAQIGVGAAIDVWKSGRGRACLHRLNILSRWLRDAERGGKATPVAARHAIERSIANGQKLARDVVGAWADMLTDRGRLEMAIERYAKGAFTVADLDEAMRYCAEHCARVVTHRDEQLQGGDKPAPGDRDLEVGIDGVEEREHAQLDREDDALLLRLIVGVSGALRRRKDVLRYEHIFVDEAQDMSPVELSVVLSTCSKQRSVTLAGDIAQRLHMHNGFTDWRTVLQDLGLEHVAVEPLKLSYRSTHEIIEFATDVLGPLRNEEEGQATRTGAPVELFRFAHSGDAVGFLGEALRELIQGEPLASVAVIARYPEQADLYFRGLKTAEVPYLRRIAEQDFPFKPGIDVTDVRQVKGLEFDYVVLLEVSQASYPEDDEARHLLHIAATRAAHQLWVTTTGEPSRLLPDVLRERGY